MSSEIKPKDEIDDTLPKSTPETMETEKNVDTIIENKKSVENEPEASLPNNNAQIEEIDAMQVDSAMESKQSDVQAETGSEDKTSTENDGKKANKPKSPKDVAEPDKDVAEEESANTESSQKKTTPQETNDNEMDTSKGVGDADVSMAEAKDKETASDLESQDDDKKETTDESSSTTLGKRKRDGEEEPKKKRHKRAPKPYIATTNMNPEELESTQKDAERREIAEDDISKTLIIKGLYRELGETRPNRELMKLLNDKFHILPAILQRFHKRDDLWRITLRSDDDLAKLVGKTVDLNLKAKKKNSTDKSVVIDFDVPLTQRKAHAKIYKRNLSTGGNNSMDDAEPPSNYACYCNSTEETPLTSPSDLRSVDLRCGGCKKFFHQKCLKIKIKNPPLPGDWNYLFYCRRCHKVGSTEESFQFQGKDNSDVYIIVLYNLYLLSKMQGCQKTLFHICAMNQFIDKYWNQLHSWKVSQKDMHKVSLTDLRRFPEVFTNGHSRDDCDDWWGLRDYSNPLIDNFPIIRSRRSRRKRKPSTDTYTNSPALQRKKKLSKSDLAAQVQSAPIITIQDPPEELKANAPLSKPVVVEPSSESEKRSQKAHSDDEVAMDIDEDTDHGRDDSSIVDDDDDYDGVDGTFRPHDEDGWESSSKNEIPTRRKNKNKNRDGSWEANYGTNELAEIVGAKRSEGQLLMYIRFEGFPNYSFVPAEKVKATYPRKVMEFYESRLIFSNTTNNPPENDEKVENKPPQSDAIKNLLSSEQILLIQDRQTKELQEHFKNLVETAKASTKKKKTPRKKKRVVSQQELKRTQQQQIAPLQHMMHQMPQQLVQPPMQQRIPSMNQLHAMQHQQNIPQQHINPGMQRANSNNNTIKTQNCSRCNVMLQFPGSASQIQCPKCRHVMITT